MPVFIVLGLKKAQRGNLAVVAIQTSRHWIARAEKGTVKIVEDLVWCNSASPPF